jgi:hypothetical protein
MASRPLLLALIGLIILMVASWALGEALRQRKTTKRRPKR